MYTCTLQSNINFCIVQNFDSILPHTYRTETPTAKYGNRQNRGSITSTYNDAVVPSVWAGLSNDVIINVLPPSLTTQPQFMYQNIVRKSLQ